MHISKEARKLLLPLHSSATIGKMLPATVREERLREGKGGIASYLCFLTGSVWANYASTCEVFILFKRARLSRRRLLGSCPTPSHHHLSSSCLSFSVFLCVAGRAYWQERGVEWECGGGGEPNHTTARKPCPLKIIQYSLVPYMWFRTGSFQHT